MGTTDEPLTDEELLSEQQGLAKATAAYRTHMLRAALYAILAIIIPVAIALDKPFTAALACLYLLCSAWAKVFYPAKGA